MEGFHTFKESCFGNLTREFTAFGTWLETELKGRDEALKALHSELASAKSSNERLTLKLRHALDELSSTKRSLNAERHDLAKLKSAVKRVAPLPSQVSSAARDVDQPSVDHRRQDSLSQQHEEWRRKYELMKKQAQQYKNTVVVLLRRLKKATAIPTAQPAEKSITEEGAASDSESQDASAVHAPVGPNVESQATEPDARRTDNFGEFTNVKRKRSRSLVKSAEPDGTQNQPFNIKDEPGSSPVELIRLLGAHPTSDNLDLDELQGAVETPRKRRRLRLMLENEMRQTPFITTSPTKSSFDLEASALETELFDVEVAGHECNSLESDSFIAPSPMPQLQQTTAMQPPTANAQRNPQIASIRSASRDTPRGTKQPDSSRVLKPLSVNRRFLKASFDKAEKRQISRADDKAIASVAEDGSWTVETKASRLDMEAETGLSATATPTPGIARLESLLNRRKFSGEPLPSDSMSPRAWSKPRQSTIHESLAQGNTTDGQEHRTVSPAKVRPLPSALTPRMVPQAERTSPSRQPLRNRPVKELRLEDFKLNPSRNQGIDFAFVEVVRNQEQRKSMAHCTRPECCGGSFSKAVQIAGAPERRSGLWEDPSSSRHDEDLLLRDFLGTEATLEDVRKLSSQERNELISKARIASFASSHGKHRHSRHRRQSTPPGFWRTDMPSTQEMEQDRALAEERERRKVEERYAEALQTNGLWKFRDE